MATPDPSQRLDARTGRRRANLMLALFLFVFVLLIAASSMFFWQGAAPQ
jgi:hypothetical protein